MEVWSNFIKRIRPTRKVMAAWSQKIMEILQIHQRPWNILYKSKRKKSLLLSVTCWSASDAPMESVCCRPSRIRSQMVKRRSYHWSGYVSCPAILASQQGESVRERVDLLASPSKRSTTSSSSWCLYFLRARWHFSLHSANLGSGYEGGWCLPVG